MKSAITGTGQPLVPRAADPERPIPCPCCGQRIKEGDWRPTPVRWIELVHLVDGARQRAGWTEAHLEYLRAAIAITWAKAFARGRVAKEEDDKESLWRKK